MREEERKALNRVFVSNCCIDISTGFKEGDSVKVISGALMGQESRILRINKGRQEAVISMAMFNTAIPVSVGLEVIEKYVV
jgi:transcription antitermination factor NusG